MNEVFLEKHPFIMYLSFVKFKLYNGKFTLKQNMSLKKKKKSKIQIETLGGT